MGGTDVGASLLGFHTLFLNLLVPLSWMGYLTPLYLSFLIGKV